MLETSSVLGAAPLTFLLFTCGLAGWLAFMTGKALAVTWRPMWQAIPYTIFLGVAERFLNFALFGGELLSLGGFIIDTLLLMAVSLASYRVVLSYRMAAQYPWVDPDAPLGRKGGKSV